MRLERTIVKAASAAVISAAGIRFRAAAKSPRSIQERKLLDVLRRAGRTEFGRKHRFGAIRTAAEFQKRVPLSTYADYVPWIERIKSGAAGVLTTDKVERLHLTSGTNGDSKSIPFTSRLRTEFFAGIGPWIENLYRVFPAQMSGPAHWVVSPPCAPRVEQSTAVPIGFDDDEAYLPAVLRKLLTFEPVVPAEAGRADDAEQFFYQTALFLLKTRNLSFISMWSPTYLSVQLEAAVRNRARLIETIYSGAEIVLGGRSIKLSPDRERARELERTMPAAIGEVQTADWNSVWPNLRLLSCWTDGWSRVMADKVAVQFPEATIQGKGLLATEGFVTLPYQASPDDDSAPVLSICSHFFEFIHRRTGRILLADEIAAGEEYKVVITTSGGLYRYQLGDLVRCDGFYKLTPRLRFLGREDTVTDLCGEKLDNSLVGASIERILKTRNVDADLAFLAPLPDRSPPCYGLYIHAESAELPSDLAVEVDRALRVNYYYDQSRSAGQLGPPVLRPLDAEGRNRYREQIRRTRRESSAKWKPLEPAAVWEEFFFQR